MSIKSDKWIIKQCKEKEMISPYAYETIREINGKKVISYGVSGYGYDIRVANEFKLCYQQYNILSNSYNSGVNVIDPKANNKFFVELCQDVIEIPPNSMMLCRSVEYFKIPRNVLVIAVGKSTYARCGIVCNITPLEPEWEGYLTIELSNTTPLPVKIYANEGIAQLLFFEADDDDICKTSYADKGGKYQKQIGVQEAKL